MKVDKQKHIDIRNYPDTETALTIEHFLNNGETLASIIKRYD